MSQPRRAPLGTMDWARRTGGRLSRRDQLNQLFLAARARLAARMTVRRPAPAARHVQLAEAPPDSTFTKAAFAVASELSSDVLLAHCMRTWLWSDLLAQAEQLRHDAELLYAACILHDLGLTPEHWCRRTECFAVEGAYAALDLGLAHGYPRAEELANAVCLHLNAAVPVTLGVEAHLLHAGAAMDIAAIGAKRLPADARTEVLRRHPRNGFLDEIAQLGVTQAAARPRSRIALLRRVGLITIARHADARFTTDRPADR